MSSLLINSKITLNVSRPNSGVVVYGKQYDMAGRIIDISLVDGADVWDPPSGSVMLAMCAKPDGKTCIYDIVEPYEQYSDEKTYAINDKVIREGYVWTCRVEIQTPEPWNSNHWTHGSATTPAVSRTGPGQVRLILAEQALTCPGNVLFSISFYQNDIRSTTLSFILSVEKSPDDNTSIASSDYFNILSRLISGLLSTTTHPPKIDPNTKNWLIFDATQNDYIDSGYSSVGTTGPTGPQGISITSVTKTSGTGAPGTRDVYSVNLSNETVGGTFNVYNGQDGEGAPGSQVPLKDYGSGDVGEATAYSREDHRHPIPSASDIPSANNSTVQTDINDLKTDSTNTQTRITSLETSVGHLPTWAGKHALIIGDSWTAGWNGSESVQSWTVPFLSHSGLTADVIAQSSGGFTLAGNSTSTYPNENFTQVLEHVKNNSYDLIIVQDGVNDIMNSVVDLDTALSNFKSACDTYWPGVPIYFVVTVPCYYLVGSYLSRATALINMSISRGYYVITETVMLSLSGSDYKGTDAVHLNLSGYNMLAYMVAGLIIGQKIDVIPSQVSYPSNSYVLKNFSINSSNATSSDYYVRCLRQTIGVYVDATIESTATSGFIEIASGLPTSSVEYTYIGAAINRTDRTMPPIPIYVNNDSLIIQNITNTSLQNKRLILPGSYITKSI